MIFQIIIGVTFAVGVYFLLANRFQLPYYKTSKAIVSLSKHQKEKTSLLDVWLKGIASWIARHLKLNDFKRAQLLADLQTAQMQVTPEEFRANAIVKSLLVGIFAIPTLFLFPILSPVILFLAVFLYIRENKTVTKKIHAKRDRIEFELPRLVFTIEKTLKHNRDVLYMLESYAENAGPEMKNELKITAADMRSGNYEAAITRLETRVGSAMMSDVCRGLIGILRGDDTAAYWASLAIKFNDVQRQQLRMEAQKVPKKVKRLSMCLLICFMLIYVVVILEQIVTSIQNTFSHDLIALVAGEQSLDLAGESTKVLKGCFLISLDVEFGLLNLLCLIAFAYCVVKIFFQNIKRGGILLIQIGVGSLYMFSVPRGYTDGFMQWVRQVIAICFTAFLQTTLLFIGLLTFPDHMLLGLGIMLAANEVERIARQFGLDSSVKVNIMSVVRDAEALCRSVEKTGPL